MPGVSPAPLDAGKLGEHVKQAVEIIEEGGHGRDRIPRALAGRAVHSLIR